MLFQFPPVIEAGIMAGKYAQVFSSTGIPLSIARDTTTGQFVGHAVGMLDSSGFLLNPLTVPTELATSGLEMYQMHRGFQAVQASLGVLQTTTVVIGVGVAATVALSAVNLYQTLKLRKAVERLELKVENGFIDLKQALSNQGIEIIQHIDQVTQNLIFEQHRLILIRAYGLFIKAVDRIRSAIKLSDFNRRNNEIDAARGMLFEALADYTNSELLGETSAPGQLRRLECCWLIEQTIIGTYQLQNEFVVATDRLEHLQNTIRQDTVNVINNCVRTEELEFLFPEITRIHDQDLLVLNSWQNHLEWMNELPPSELKVLESSDFSTSQMIPSKEKQQTVTVIPEPEVELYKSLQEISHPSSIQDQLIFMMQPELREDYESYISQESKKAGYKVFIPTNLKKASNFTIANLYWYFRSKDESEDEMIAGQERDISFIDNKANSENEQSLLTTSNPQKEQIFKAVKQVISQRLGLEEKNITLQSHLIKDLDADFLDIIEMIIDLQNKFNIEIEDEDTEALETVEQLIDYLFEKVKLN